MASKTKDYRRSSLLLIRSLQLDGVVVGLSGLVLVVGAGPIASYLGVNVPLVLSVVGIIFAAYGGALLWVLTRGGLVRQLGYAVAGLNTIWVLVSLAILLTDWLPLTYEGRLAVVVVAIIVAAFAAVQLYGLRIGRR